jgi:hypothetical protein
MKMKMKMKIANVKERIRQISVVMFLFFASPIRTFASSVTPTDTAANAPTWLNKLSGVLTEPLGWIKWLAILGGVLLLAVNGLKYKAANGDPGKMEKAMNGIKGTAIGAIIIFSAAGIGQWFFGKLQ